MKIDLNTLVSLFGCALTCLLFSGVLGTILHFLGIGLSLITTLLNFVFGIVNGGPVVWCGCFLLITVCGGCSLLTLAIALALPDCGTSHALNICRLFGY
jgi:hypothetical protein